MLSTIVVITVFSILIIVHEFGHFIMAKRCGVKVERFSIGFGPKIISIKKRETEYRISLIPLGGYVKMAGETNQDEVTGAKWEFLSQPPGQRFKILISGAIFNYILGFLLFSIVFMLGIPSITNEVGGVLDNFPAKKAGIKPGDKVISIDGEKITYWNELTRAIYRKTEEKISIEVLRDGKTFQLEIKPVTKEVKDMFGKNINIALIGITPAYLKYNPIEAFYRGFLRIFDMTILTFKGIWGLITGRLSLRESAMGPIGIFISTATVAKLGIARLLEFMATISMALAIFNVLPIPVLDGGYIIFIAIEKIRRRPLSPKTQEIAIQAGLGLLIILMLFVSYYDIIRFFVRR